MSAIKIKDVNLTFESASGPVEALSDINLDVKHGEFISFIGPSGCGKTTLLRAVADLQAPTSGSIEVNDMPHYQARKARQYGFVFQTPTLYPWRTVRKNVELPLEVFGMEKEERRKLSKQSLELVGLSDFSEKYPWQLSGGMQQRVSIARALSFEAPILLMDEPFSALDEINRDHLNKEFFNLWQKTQKTILFVTHSILEAVFLSSQVVVMSRRPGKIVTVLDTSAHIGRRNDPGFKDSSVFLDHVREVRQVLRSTEKAN